MLLLETYCRSYFIAIVTSVAFVIHLILYSRVLLINAVALYTVIKKLKHFIQNIYCLIMLHRVYIYRYYRQNDFQAMKH